MKIFTRKLDTAYLMELEEKSIASILPKIKEYEKQMETFGLEVRTSYFWEDDYTGEISNERIGFGDGYYRYIYLSLFKDSREVELAGDGPDEGGDLAYYTGILSITRKWHAKRKKRGYIIFAGFEDGELEEFEKETCKTIEAIKKCGYSFCDENPNRTNNP